MQQGRNEQESTTKPYFTIEEMVGLPNYSGIHLSADGTRLAYVERVTDWDENRYVDRIWIYDRKAQKPVLLTNDTVGGTSPRWSPDGTRLAYLRTVGSNENRRPQLFLKSDEQAQGVQLTSNSDGVSHLRFAPDSRGIYYLAAPTDSKLKSRKETYGDIEYVDVDYRRKTLYYVNIQEAVNKEQHRYTLPKDQRPDVITNADGRGSKDESVKSSDSNTDDTDASVKCFDLPSVHIQGFDVSPDGRKVVFTGVPSPNFEDFHEAELYLFDTTTGDVTKLAVPELTLGNGESLSFTGRIEGQVHFAPDSERFVFTYRIDDAKMFRNNAVALYHLETGEVTAYPVHIDEQLSIIDWTMQGLVVEWQNRTNRWIETFAETGERTPLVTGEGVMAFGSSVSADGRSIAYVQASIESPTDVVLDGERITGLAETFALHRMSQRRVIQWASRDGSAIEGVLCVPDDFDESKQYPLLLVVHGGPTWASFPSPTQDKYYPIEQFIERGFIVLLPNYRGSSGYGQAFRSLNERNLGVGDYEDVISGVDFLVEKGFVDKSRVGVMGWSQGGYISAFCTTYSQEFKAVSVGAGISNWVTYYVNTDIHPFTRDYLGATPWEDMEVYQKTSPMTYIRNAATPTLIQHGDKDTRVPLPNAFELYQGLRDVGAETKLVVYKGMQHGSDKPGWNRAILHQNYAWFCHYILGDSLDAFWL